MILRATAPGKVVLTGEYAVLDGAPAISAAVNRRAVASIADVGELGDTQLAEAVRRALGLAALPDGLHLDTSTFSAPGRDGGIRKLGIGSSAALTVATCRLLAAPDAAEGDILDAALAAHADLQGGRGSGVDVATSVAGGVVRYDAATRKPVAAGWPPGLRVRFWWSGVPARTNVRIARLRAATRLDSADRLAASAAAAAEAWSGGDADVALRSLADFRDALRAFSGDHGLDVFGAGHDRLAAVAADRGIVYKPCGAGGGDVGAAFATDSASLDAFADAIRDTRFVPLDLRVDEHGVRREERAA